MAEFDDGKDAGALRTIGEVGEALGIKAHVLRYWEDQFAQLKPLKRSGGRRYYRPEDIALVREIDRLVNREGYTLRGAKTALKEFRPNEGEAAVPSAQPAFDLVSSREEKAGSAPSEVIARLRSIRASLAAALAL